MCVCACVPVCLIYKVLTSAKQNIRTFHDKPPCLYMLLPYQIFLSTVCSYLSPVWKDSVAPFPYMTDVNCACLLSGTNDLPPQELRVLTPTPGHLSFILDFSSLFHTRHANPLLSWLSLELLWLYPSLPSVFSDHTQPLGFNFGAASSLSGTPSRLLNFSLISALDSNYSLCHTR